MVEKTDHIELSKRFIGGLMDGRYEYCHGMFDRDIGALVPLETMGQMWTSQMAPFGSMVGLKKSMQIDLGRYQVVDSICSFENGDLSVHLMFNGEKVSGLNIRPYFSNFEEPIPEGIREESVLLNKDSDWPLAGIMDLSSKGSSIAVVLVHGSGPQDMDCTVSANKPFRDIGRYLALNGIDVLRYDKRTYEYPVRMGICKDVTVEIETIEDAASAAEFMRSRGYDKVYLLGHSMGGMLAPRIASEHPGSFDGIISMAGSPRTLLDIMSDQNHALLDSMPDENTKAMMKIQIDKEEANIEQMMNWDAEEAGKQTIYGVPACYFIDMNSNSAANYALKLDIPMLFMQGECDFQVNTEKDFRKWEEILNGKKNVSFKQYPGLNHLFMLSQGEAKGTPGEYCVPGHVDGTVLNDIVTFIKN